MKKVLALTLALALLTSGMALAQTADTAGLTLTFTENPTTGYTWTCKNTDEAILTVTDAGYTAGADAANAEGAGGTHTWALTGVAEGDVTVTFTLGQAWDGGEVADTIVYSLHVDANKAVTQTAVAGYPDLYAPGKAAVLLSENPTTGYEWKYTASDDHILTLEKDEFQAPATDAVGAGGTYLWVFTGAKEGDVTLTFEYARSWEAEVKPDATIVYTFHVDAGLNVTQTSVDGDYDAYNPLAPQTAE
ncbi:MAG TPA: protease inhibitor I42 family protein [Candidatus Limiplasma sp.]|nr:protease inhibitor I42 family protein [Candidatus Limiplasma sp.]HPS80707.1 protease inhibitor I42 family protein [Candidatus Limiplasma sp.]